jgi:4-amino-4-deoxy-L-arabinose transferase-like glycosyltransferase
MFLLIIIFLSIRIAWLFLMPFELFGDEAQYWFWSQNLDFGYYSKPPIVAWAIKATTLFCGNQEACIRLSSPIFHALTAIITYLIGIQLFNYRVGLFSAIVYLTLPAVSLSANIISTDPFLLFFWSLSIYMTLKAIENDKWLSWIIAGISCGLGMMSKYSMVLFLLCLLLFLFTEKKLKHYLSHPKFWVAAIIALLVWIPNLWWNITHSMASFGHVLDQVKGPEIRYLNLEAFFKFIVVQFAIFGPFLLGYILVRIGMDKALYKRQTIRFLLCFSLPFLLVAAGVALFSRAHANWAVPCYIAFSVLLSYLSLVKYKQISFLYLNIFLHIFIAFSLMIYAYNLGHSSLLPLNNQTDILKRVRGNKEIGSQLAQICKQYPNLKVAHDDRMNIAIFQYYTLGKCSNIIKWNPSKIIHDHFDLTTDLNNYKKQDIIFITNYYKKQDLEHYAKAVEQLSNLSYIPYQGFEKKFNVYILKGFKGY